MVDIDVRDLDDLRHSAHTVSGRFLKADGTVRLQRKYHRVDAVSLRTEHYSSLGKIASTGDLEGSVPQGAAVEVLLSGDKKAIGRFRAYREFFEVRTAGYVKDEMLPESDLVYTAPDR